MRSRPTPFVVLTKARSGSSWLIELLDSHDEVVAFGEMFGELGGYGADGLPSFDEFSRVRPGWPGPLLRAAYLRRLFAVDPAARAIGVKVMYGHAGRGVHEYLTLRRARVVHLIRANVLDAVVSYEVAKARDQFEVREGSSTRPMTVSLDPSTIRQRLEQHSFSIEQARARILHYRLPWHEVFYEELVARREETLRGILDFLDVPPQPLRSSFVPVDDLPREGVLENLADVREALDGTRFAWMLDEPRRRTRHASAR